MEGAPTALMGRLGDVRWEGSRLRFCPAKSGRTAVVCWPGEERGREGLEEPRRGIPLWLHHREAPVRYAIETPSRLLDGYRTKSRGCCFNSLYAPASPPCCLRPLNMSHCSDPWVVSCHTAPLRVQPAVDVDNRLQQKQQPWAKPCGSWLCKHCSLTSCLPRFSQLKCPIKGMHCNPKPFEWKASQQLVSTSVSFEGGGNFYQSCWASRVALAVKNPPANVGDVRDTGWIPGSGRSPGKGNGNLLQYSCLENPMERGVWQATVHSVAKSDTTVWLSSQWHCISLIELIPLVLALMMIKVSLI